MTDLKGLRTNDDQRLGRFVHGHDGRSALGRPFGDDGIDIG